MLIKHLHLVISIIIMNFLFITGVSFARTVELKEPPKKEKSLSAFGMNAKLSSVGSVEIYSMEDLQRINDDLSGDYVLMTDLDASNYSFVTIGKVGEDTFTFVGNFDGNGHTISNLTINEPDEYFVGLFAGNDGYINNIHLENVFVDGENYVGGIVGMNRRINSDDVGIVRNCSMTGFVIGDTYVGGLVGKNDLGVISYSHSIGQVEGKVCDWSCESITGGLVGENIGNIQQSYSECSVWGSISGGLTGHNAGVVLNCYAMGSVEESSTLGTQVGGLVGYNIGAISNCYAIGDIIGENFVGGLVGLASSLDITSSFWLKKPFYPYTTYAGIELTDQQMKQRSSFIGWDFDTIWTISPGSNDGYPFLLPYQGEMLFLAGNSPETFENVYVDDVDEPLRFNADLETLMTTSLYTQGVQGFVADGVTPLLVKIELPPGTYSFIQSIDGLEDDSVIRSRTRVYDFASKQFIALNNPLEFTVPTLDMAGDAANLNTGMVECFACIDGIACSDLGLKSGSKEAVCRITMLDVDGFVITQGQLLIRKPPIALVHGLDGSAKTWYEDYETKSSVFIDKIVEGGWHRDFVQPVEYGVDANGNGTPNLVASLRQNAVWLNQSLKEFENNFRQNWAMTRYYYVGHSQGGVISRYLCQRPTSVEFSFRNDQNFMRGRFYRIITIGAPHNGAQVERYCLDLSPYDVMPGVPVLPFCTYLHKIQRVITGKFDPWGKEIKQLNSLLLDEHAKYHLFITQVGNAAIVNVGLFPSQDFFEYLYPTGWDGIVEYESARAGMSDQYITYFASDSIAHTGDIVKKKLVKADEEQTQSIKIASKISEILCLDNKFGTFVNPSPASNVVLEKMRENLIYAIILSRESNYVYPFKASRSISENSIDSKFKKYVNPNLKQISANRWSLEITINKDHPPMGEIMFVPFVYGPEGLSQNGVSVQSNPAQGNQAIVTVDEDVIGDVVIYPRYFSVDRKWVFYEPVFITTLGENFLSSIKISDTIKTLLLGQSKSAVFYGVTNQGVDILLFPKSSDKIEIISSDPTILEVTERQTIRAQKTGTATLTIRYNDLEASETITVVPPETPNLDWDQDGMIDSGDLFRFANYWMTDETDYDLSNNGLVDREDLLILQKYWH